MNRFLLHVPGHPPYLLARERPELVLGRAPGVDVLLEDPAISRRHARFMWKDDAVWLEDLGSRHGIERNGARVKRAVRVEPGDRIALGLVEVRLEAAPARAGGFEETPLSLSLEDLRRWGKDGGGAFDNWREALDIVHDMSLLLLEDLEPPRLLEALLDHLFGFLGASRGAVLLKGEDGALSPLAVRAREAVPEGPLDLAPAALEATVSRRAAMLYREPQAYDPESREGLLAQSHTTSAMAVPLECDGQTLGLFYFDASRGRGPFTELDLRFVASLSNLAAAKLIHQNTAAELRRREERERELRARESEARARSEFLARMSHEIRTPMNAVLGFTRLALGEDLPPRAADWLRKIDLSGRSLMAVVNDVLDFSRMEAGKVTLEALPFRVQDVLEGVRDLFAQAAAEKGLALEVAVPDTPRVLGDAHRLAQVLANLVGNAVKFTERGGVKVRAQATPEGLQFAVEDTGIGIEPAQAESLFSPYTQADESISRRYGGTGLGLSIARNLVELMGGTLAVASAPGAGSTFTFTLALEPAREGSPDLSGRRILLVEDNDLNRQLALTLLTGAGAGVETAATGEEALAKAAAAPYSAVLMDLHLPGLDGLETARRMRAGGLAMPILAMTADPGARSRCLEAGMDDCLSKPVEARLLLEALARPDPLAALAGVMDAAAALGRLGGRRDLLARFLRGFLADPITPAQVREAMAQGDRAGASTLAHDLRGIAGSLGLPAVARLATDLEGCLEADAAGWEEACAALEGAMAPFLAQAALI